jgi:hypothetical protein
VTITVRLIDLGKVFEVTMKLDDIKAKRLAPLASKYAPPTPITESALGVVGTTATTTTGSAATITFSGPVTVDGAVQFEEKKHQTPKFVRDCVAAITEKPKELARIQQKKDGSPFGICYAQYEKNKRSLAAKHSHSGHRASGNYEKALATLRNEREERRAERPSRRRVVFEHVEPQPPHHRRSVRFEAQG